MAWLFVEYGIDKTYVEMAQALINIRGVTCIAEKLPDEIKEQIVKDNSKKDMLSEDNNIFSGPNSEEMWNAINDNDYDSALYFMGCKLQELETLVRKDK